MLPLDRRCSLKGVIMTEPALTKEGREVLDSFLNTRAPITHEGLKRQVLGIVSLLMKAQGAHQAGRELVIKALKIVIPRSYHGLIYRIEDPANFQKLYASPKDLEAYYTMPRRVKRWEPLRIKPTKRPDEMKVIAVCASPRRGGNTDVLIDAALRGATDAGAGAEKITLQKLKIGFCLGCEKCQSPDFEGFCVQKDDFLGVLQKILDSDAIIIGFPIYIGRECAQLATFFDRWFCLVAHRPEPGRRAMVVGTWGHANTEDYDVYLEKVINILNSNRIATVEALSAGGFEGILHGLDEEGKAMILRFPKELEKAYQAGKSLVIGDG